MNNKEQLKEIREMTYKRIHYGKEEQFTDKFQKKKKNRFCTSDKEQSSTMETLSCSLKSRSKGKKPNFSFVHMLVAFNIPDTGKIYNFFSPHWLTIAKLKKKKEKKKEA